MCGAAQMQATQNVAARRASEMESFRPPPIEHLQSVARKARGRRIRELLPNELRKAIVEVAPCVDKPRNLAESIWLQQRPLAEVRDGRRRQRRIYDGIRENAGRWAACRQRRSRGAFSHTASRRCCCQTEASS